MIQVVADWPGLISYYHEALAVVDVMPELEEEESRPESTSRTRVRRLPERGAYDRVTIDGILDEALICHVGFVEGGQPYVIPTIHARDDDQLYLHGSAGSRMLRTIAGGIPICVTVTIQDGLVLARSAFHHSMNYRSVVVLGTAVEVEDHSEQLHAMEKISEHVAPGRWAEVRQPNDREIRQTRILRIGLGEASAKIRSGGPKDDEEDFALAVWAGLLPFRLVPQEPVTDERVPDDVGIPEYVVHHRLGVDGRASSS
jgi:nitroimidazol reductase NimA-like FMN-containing flavoprotein (pyridoxamine 5'-phosphate oxidase superfamily)